MLLLLLLLFWSPMRCAATSEETHHEHSTHMRILYVQYENKKEKKANSSQYL